MGFKIEDYREEIEHLVVKADEDLLTEWETEFVNDMSVKDDSENLSHAQVAVIQQLIERYV